MNTWTKSDEITYRTLMERREVALAERREALEIVASKLKLTGGSLCANLITNATELRDALEPYDSWEGAE